MEAYFAAGCFWHVQYTFDKLNVKTEAGYMGGNEANYPNPSYEQVCSDKTGYAETVKVEYDEKKISYKKLLEVFWKEHDPTSYNKQGADVGSQYRAVIFYTNEQQKKEAEKSKKKIEKMLKGKKIYTAIEKAGRFFKAEEYHQKYLCKHEGSCRVS